jgi:TPR repeat protein
VAAADQFVDRSNRAHEASTEKPSGRKLGQAEAAALSQRAERLLGAGDVPAARLILRLLADNQDAHAAYLLAKTFDPAFLQESRTIGIHGDAAQARSWYEKARGLGSAQAAEALQSNSGRALILPTSN